MPTTFAKDYILGFNCQMLGHAPLPKLLQDVLDRQNLCQQNGVQKLFAYVTLYNLRKTKFEENLL